MGDVVLGLFRGGSGPLGCIGLLRELNKAGIGLRDLASPVGGLLPDSSITSGAGSLPVHERTKRAVWWGGGPNLADREVLDVLCVCVPQVDSLVDWSTEVVDWST